MPAVKITVLKRTLYEDIAEEYRTAAKERCELFTEGQEFMAEETGPYGLPKGFCPFAWDDIYKFFFVLKQGGRLCGRYEGRKDRHRLLHRRG